MKFLFPQFLWALSALAIPVIIHLFNFQRPRKAVFSNVAMLENIKTQTSNIQMLKHWLVLLSRLLFLGLLVLAFAQPFLPASDSAKDESKAVRVFYIDNSYSMQNEIDGNSLIHAANLGVERMIDQLDNNAEIYFLDNNFEVKDLFPYSKQAFLNRLAEIEETYISRTAADIMQRVQQIDHKGAKEVFIISDLQTSTFGNSAAFASDSTNKYYIVPLQNTEISNVYPDSIWMENPFALMNENAKINLRLSNTGDRAIESFPVNLYVDKTQAAASTADLPAEGSVNLTFNLSASPSKSRVGKVSFDDSPVFFDNEYFFVLNSLPSLKIVVIGEQENKYLKAVYATADFFEYEFMPAGNPNLSSMEEADFIILDKPNSMPDFMKSFIEKYLDNGKQLLFILPENSETVEDICQLSGLRYKSKIESEAVQKLAVPDINDPFFKNVFEKIEDNTRMPALKPSYAISGFNNGHLKFRSGEVFLGSKRKGLGNLYFITSPLDQSNDGLYKHALFVPLMYKMAIERFDEKSSRMAFNFDDDQILWPIFGKGGNELILKIRNESIELIPEQNRTVAGIVFSLPKANLRPGIFQILINDSLSGEIALNVAAKESKMQFADVTEIKSQLSAFEHINIADVNAFETFSDAYKTTHFGTPLWKYFLICSIIFLFAEIFLLRLL